MNEWYDCRENIFVCLRLSEQINMEFRLTKKAKRWLDWDLFFLGSICLYFRRNKMCNVRNFPGPAKLEAFDLSPSLEILYISKENLS